jgi:GxxExxY protein
MDIFEFRERGASGVDPKIEDLAHNVIGACIEVHRHLGAGLPESAYRRAVSRELSLRGIAHQCEVTIPIVYKGEAVGERRVDIFVIDGLVLELKAVDALNDTFRAQVLTYLQLLKLPLGLLINFNVAILRNGIKRVINSYIPK